MSPRWWIMRLSILKVRTCFPGFSRPRRWTWGAAKESRGGPAGLPSTQALDSQRTRSKKTAISRPSHSGGTRKVFWYQAGPMYSCLRVRTPYLSGPGAPTPASSVVPGRWMEPSRVLVNHFAPIPLSPGSTAKRHLPARERISPARRAPPQGPRSNKRKDREKIDENFRAMDRDLATFPPFPRERPR